MDEPKTQEGAQARLAVACIGASAGGLEATSDLLRNLPGDVGLAAVVIHHLDPTQKSILADLLAKATVLPVTVAADGDRLQANRVYVVPAGADLRVDSGVLRIEPREPGRAHMPIDRFLRSLAGDPTCRSVGVILSGTGSDGTLGAMAIKAEGGITFAQDASAQFDGMPTSAIRAGCVDFVLPPKGIARELVRVATRPDSTPPDDWGKEDEEELLAALRRASGIDFAQYKRSTVRRRIERRIVLRRLGSLREYIELSKQDSAELDALAGDMFIHVTSFFRDPNVFQALMDKVFPKLVTGRPHDIPIRVWVPGCSSGEEVYSLAIALLDFFHETAIDFPIKIFGTDVRQESIDKARAGRYPDSIAADVSPRRLARYFEKLEGGYKIRKGVRDRCVFARQDITRDAPFPNVDLISCRNVMIYLGPALQNRVLPLFHTALRDPGFLLLGASEGIRQSPGFAAVESSLGIHARTAALPQRVLVPLEARWRDTPTALTGTSSTSNYATTHLEIHREADQAVLAAHGPPGVVVTEDLVVVQFRGQTGAFLEHSPGTATLGLLQLAREELRIDLRRLIEEAWRTGASARQAGLRLNTGQELGLEVIPFSVPSSRQKLCVVLFQSEGTTPAEGDRDESPAVGAEPRDDAIERALRAELGSTREYLQSVIEQLEAGNEELKAGNEEIVSSNEELQSANEELQTAQEELHASNDELSQRIFEATRLSDDLVNVFTSAAIPIVIVGRDSRIAQITPAARSLFNLLDTDVGRSIGDIKPRLIVPDLTQLISEVVERFVPAARTVQDDQGRWYDLTVRPYVTSDNRIDGTVLAVFDVDRLKKSERLLSDAQAYAENIVDAVRDGLLVLDEQLCVRSANRSFYRMFAVSREETLSGRLPEIASGLWNIPELTALVEALYRSGQLEDFRAEIDLPTKGRRVMLINGRRIAREGPSASLILLAFADVTEHVRAEDALRRDQIREVRVQDKRRIREYQTKLQDMAFDAALVEERERRRIAADLHDRIGQSLALAQMKLASTQELATGELRATHEAAIQLLQQSIADTRSLTFELSPPVLYDLGLPAALAWLADQLEERYALHVEVDGEKDTIPGLENEVAALLFRSVRELLMNVIKHGRTKSASVSIKLAGDQIGIEVRDGGAGFDPSGDSSWSDETGFGLFSVREQMSRLGGAFVIQSSPGKGTYVMLRVPLVKASQRSRPPSP